MEEEIVTINWELELDGVGVASDPHDAFVQPLREVLVSGQPAGQIEYLLLCADDGFRVLGTLRCSNDGRIFFYPAFGRRIARTEGAAVATAAELRGMQIGLLQLSDDRKSWSTTLVGEPSIRVGPFGTVPVTQTITQWFTSAVRNASRLPLVPATVRVESVVPTSESERRSELLLQALRGIRFRAIDLKNLDGLKAESFLLFHLYLAPKDARLPDDFEPFVPNGPPFLGAVEDRTAQWSSYESRIELVHSGEFILLHASSHSGELRDDAAVVTPPPPDGCTPLSYFCAYCLTYHEPSTASREHIIPEALLNKNYVLSPVCRRVNNLMACSFEGDVVRSRSFREALLVFDKPRGEKRVGTAVAADGSEYERYMIRGESQLRSKPEYLTGRTITITTIKRDGTEIPFELDLPFDVIRRVKGSVDLVKRERVARQIDNDAKRVFDYVAQLAKDSSSHETLTEFLRLHDARMKPPAKITVDSQERIVPADLVELIPEELPVDHEKNAKFFIKIAWTHACKQLGRDALNDPVADFILDFLTSGAVGEAEAALGRDLFTEPNTIDGKLYYFWRHAPAESVDKCAKLSEPAREILEPLARKRLGAFEQLRGILHFERATLNFDTALEYPELRYHELSLVNVELHGVAGLCCSIKLFGGTFSGLVRVLATPWSAALPGPVRIDF